MAQIVETHVRKRGFFGWIFLSLFWAFNAFMALWAWLSFQMLSSIDVGPSSAAKAGHAIGGAIGGAVILFVWLVGAVILGLFALLSRGTKTVVIRQN